jgi:hypothetical protein
MVKYYSQLRKASVSFEDILKANPVLSEKGFAKNVKKWDFWSDMASKIGIPDYSEESAKFIAFFMSGGKEGEVTEEQSKKMKEILSNKKTSSIKKFQTSDGFVLELKGNVWTDGDLEFENVNGIPVDSLGEPLEGKMV